MKTLLQKLSILQLSHHQLIIRVAFSALLATIFITLTTLYYQEKIHLLSTKSENLILANKIASSEAKLKLLLSRDEYKINKENEQLINDIQKSYLKASSTYEKLVDFKGKQRGELDSQFSKLLKLLSDKNYQEAQKLGSSIAKTIDDENSKLIANTTTPLPVNAPQSNTPPTSGFSQQKVHIDAGDYLVSIVSADLNSTRVIVDTASESDCQDNCSVLSLADYVKRSGAYAGINGSFFCPAAYPSCAGKTNSFDTLLMNKNKRYFNSDNNIYSQIPAVVFSGSSARFLAKSMDWGRDTSVDSLLANYPLYLLGGQPQFSGSGDPKIDSIGARTFIANKDSTVYIGIVYGASAFQAAQVLQALGIPNALGLDQGGSTALWFEGYKAGPGRSIPNALLFVRK